MSMATAFIGVFRREQSQQKDSYRPDITVSLTGTSLFAYAIKLLCTEWTHCSVMS